MLIDIMVLAALHRGSTNFLSISCTSIIGCINPCIAGMITGLTLERYQERLRHPAVLAALLLGWAFIVMAFHAQGGITAKSNPLWIVFPTVEGVCWSAILASYLSCNWNLPSRLSKLLAYGGAISYSLYVWHGYIMLWLCRVTVPLLKDPRSELAWLNGLQHVVQQFPFEASVLFALLVVLPITASVSLITYHCIELPFFFFFQRYIFPESKCVCTKSADQSELQDATCGTTSNTKIGSSALPLSK